MTDRELIRKCDGDFYERLCDVADTIGKACIGEEPLKIVLLSGPTCSGKTTAAAMLADRLDDYGMKVEAVSIDDFYFDREYLERLSEYKGNGRIDYDSVDTIDICALKRFVNELFADGRAYCPTFDFKSGSRAGFREIVNGDDTVFVFEGIQAVYPEITEIFGPFKTVSVYIAPITPISVGGQVFEPDEIRFMRRIVRDSNFRNTDAEFTMALWESVRSNEENHIFPYVDKCTYRIDSTHRYEIGILKPYLEKILSKLDENSVHRDTACGLLERLRRVAPIDSALVESGSLYKEFV